MAASRVAGAIRRLCRRYRFFFYVAVFLISMQLFLAWNFYNFNVDESNRLRLLEEKLKLLESKHKKSPPSDDSQLPALNGQGAAEGYKIINPVVGIGHKPDSNDVHHGVNQVPVVQDSPDKVKRKNDTHALANQRRKQRLRQAILQDLGYHVDENFDFERECDSKYSKETESALVRASTEQCQKEIMMTACLDMKGMLYPKKLPRHCPLQDTAGHEYLGCFEDSDRTNRLLSGTHVELKGTNTPEKCIAYCLRMGYNYAGVQFSFECWCSDHMRRQKPIDESRCDNACSGNKTLMCGGYLTLGAYSTGYGARPYSYAGYVRPEDVPENVQPARIVFVFTVNGRALRQVKRLFKALYHRDHYYYIHVDARQDYLYRQLKGLANQFTNVRLMERRLSTIWGGASLLKMHLAALQDLVAMDDWKWDFFINLSESDYPIKTFEDLVAFLTVNKGKNFVRSHGKDTPKFLRKQGLDKTFYECDNHMWRLGSREIPDGIRIDGGSDWITLSREFAKYLVTGTDELVLGLKQMYRYTLLPSESFFHTLLQNSKFCTQMINNNLHLTNWNRKRGCKCQYKAIVDWCGCSPNDFFPADLEKILVHENQPTYFARKFEAVVNQEVINELDSYLFGPYPKSTQGYNSFWQSEYEHQDKEFRDEMLTFYQSFSRLGVTQVHTSLKEPPCQFTTLDVLEAHVYNHADNFQGILVHYTAKSTSTRQTYELETFVQPIKHYKIIKPIGPINRLKLLQVGTKYDPKEELFRNYGGLFGPYSEVELMHSWGGEGSQFTFTAVFVDPSNNVAVNKEVHVKGTEVTETVKPSLVYPLQPGIWTVKIMYLWEPVAETQFLVTPLTVYGGKEITDAEAKQIHKGPGAVKKGEEKPNPQIVKALDLRDGSAGVKLAMRNALKTGADLRAWIDDLTSSMWQVSDTCIVAKSNQSGCQRLPLCLRSAWSSKSPDPKSDLGAVNSKTGRIR